MTWHIEVDGQTCIGSGMCAALAPDLFALDGEYAHPLADNVDPAEVVLDVADSCPVMAITVTEGEEVVGPRP